MKVGLLIAPIQGSGQSVGRQRSQFGALVALVSGLITLVRGLFTLVRGLFTLVRGLFTLVGSVVPSVGSLVALVGTLVALVGTLVALVGTLVALVGTLVALVRGVITPISSLFPPVLIPLRGHVDKHAPKEGSKTRVSGADAMQEGPYSPPCVTPITGLRPSFSAATATRPWHHARP